MAYPNLPLMMAPAISVGIFNAICKEEGVDFKLFETTEYSDDYKNRHILMAKAGANRGVQKDERDEDYFHIKPTERIIPDFIQTVEEYEPDLILLHMQEDVVSMGLQMLDAIKDKNIPHIAGGVYAMSVPEMLIEEPLIDMVCRYEGENVVRGAIKAFREGKNFTTIDGIWWKDQNGNVRKNKPTPLVDITQVTPDFSCYEKKRWQRPVGGKHFYSSMAMETYRGCPYKCTYCNSPTTRDISKSLDLGNFMRRKPAHIVERDLLKYIEDGYDPDIVFFVDDSFLARPSKEIFEFCEMWSKYKIPFWMNTRIENCKPDVLQALKEAGIYRMTFGIESGNEEYRQKVLQRPVSNEVYYQYLDYINESDIPYSLNVIIAMPFETREMVLDTARMVRRARGYDGLTLSVWQPYRGTRLRTIAEEAGFISRDDTTVGNGIGYLDFEEEISIKMPKPYIQPDEATKMIKTFSLYAYYPDNMWDLVKKAEDDPKLFDELMANYKKEFYPGEIQIGGKSRLAHLQKFCGQHDISTSYNFEVV